MSLLSRGITLFQDEGPVAVLKKACHFVKNNFNLDFLYWTVRGVKPISVAGYSVSISIENYADYKELHFLEQNENGILEDLLVELSEDDVFLDIGAHVGVFALFARQVTPQVYAIEPYPTNIPKVFLNRRRNDISFSLYECALSDESGYVSMTGLRNKSRSDGSAMFTEFDEDGGPGQSDAVFVRVERGDEFLRSEGIPTPTVLKIDVEGAEKRVLSGLQETLQQETCRLVYCEIHGEDADGEAIASELKSYGFTVMEMTGRMYGRTLKAKRD